MRVLIADDHPMVRDAIARAVQRADADAEVHEAQDFASAQDLCESLLPELALLDLNMPGMNGIEGLRRLRLRFPALALIVASGQEDPPTIRAVLATGVSGFFPKSAAPELLLQAIRLVQAGGVYVPAGVLADFRDGVPPPVGVAGLTPRQLAVLRRLLHGWPNKVIARELGLTEGTVKVHIAAILRALQARNRTEAVVRARELGFDERVD
jgi:two-component system, NarL family, nitrate/nitrite response regulator NarL